MRRKPASQFGEDEEFADRGPSPEEQAANDDALAKLRALAEKQKNPRVLVGIIVTRPASAS
jgi:hypothetical protein